MITSTSGATVFVALRSSRPLSPGILRSASTRSTPPALSCSSPAWPSEATTTRYPSRFSVRSRLSRTAGSSSATRRVGASAIVVILEGEANRERGTPIGGVAPPDLAAVLLDDLPADGEAPPGALGLGGEERLEQGGGEVRGD